MYHKWNGSLKANVAHSSLNDSLKMTGNVNYGMEVLKWQLMYHWWNDSLKIKANVWHIDGGLKILKMTANGMRVTLQSCWWGSHGLVSKENSHLFPAISNSNSNSKNIYFQ